VMDRLGVQSSNEKTSEPSMDDLDSLLPPTKSSSESQVPSSD
jgi:hypothetical protein